MARLAVLSAAIVLSGWFGTVASAQYPPPTDQAIVSVSNPTPTVNSTVTITWRIPASQSARPDGDSRQQHVFAVSLQTPSSGAQACVPAIASQPGTDARITARSNPSDPNVGMADLFTGSTPGPIVVRIACPNGPTADITVMVQGTATATPTATLAPRSTSTATSASSPSSGGATPRPPSTGFGGVLGDGAGASDGAVATLLAVGALSVIAGGLLVFRARGRRGH